MRDPIWKVGLGLRNLGAGPVCKRFTWTWRHIDYTTLSCTLWQRNWLRNKLRKNGATVANTASRFDFHFNIQQLRGRWKKYLEQQVAVHFMIKLFRTKPSSISKSNPLDRWSPHVLQNFHGLNQRSQLFFLFHFASLSISFSLNPTKHSIREN